MQCLQKSTVYIAVYFRLPLVTTVTSCLTVHGVTCGYFRLPLVTTCLAVHGVTCGYFRLPLLPGCAWCYLWLLQVIPHCYLLPWMCMVLPVVTAHSHCYLLPGCAWCYLWLPHVPTVTSCLAVHGVMYLWLLQVTTGYQSYHSVALFLFLVVPTGYQSYHVF